MRHLVEESFRLNLFIMRVLGLFPLRNYKNFYKVYAYMIYFGFTVPVPVLAIIYLIFDDDIDLIKVSDNMFLIAQIGMFIIKLLPFIRKTSAVRANIYTLESPLFNNFTEQQEYIINDCIKTCRMIFWLFCGFCWASLFSWGFKPAFLGIYKLPVDVWLPYDHLAHPASFYLTYTFVFLGVANGATANGAVDPLVAGLACQATGQIRILKDNLQHLGKVAEEEISKGEYSEINLDEKRKLKDQIIYDKISKCINHHNAILHFIKDYEETFSSVAFWQFVASIFVICISCYELTLVSPFSFAFVAMMIYLNTMLCEIFLYCYYGTILYEESNSLTTAIYMGEWYDYDMKSKKALITLMESAKKPIIVTAGKVLDLSLVTFTTILRRAYSLFAVLQNYKT